jgi:hypothetical protein
MALQPPTRDLLIYLRTHPDLRARIRARSGATLLYAGAFFRPIWKEILVHKQDDPLLASKQILPEVLATLTRPGMPHPSVSLQRTLSENMKQDFKSFDLRSNREPS